MADFFASSLTGTCHRLEYRLLVKIIKSICVAIFPGSSVSRRSYRQLQHLSPVMSAECPICTRGLIALICYSRTHSGPDPSCSCDPCNPPDCCTDCRGRLAAGVPRAQIPHMAKIRKGERLAALCTTNGQTDFHRAHLRGFGTITI